MTSDTITVTVGDEFTISLESMATAGYLWKIDSLPDAIQSLGSQPETSTDEKPGDPTIQVFRFRALKAGEHAIMFMLARPWENKAIESRTTKVKAS